MTSQESQKVAYLGIPGSYSHRACMECFPGGTYRGLVRFRDILDYVYNGEVDYAVVPIENSTAGRVAEIYNLLPMIDLHIIGEYLLPIHHALMIPSAAFRGRLPHEMGPDEALEWKKSPLSAEEREKALADIREVRSHPQALMQCATYLSENLARSKIVEAFDTATAARDLSSASTAEIAAIASAQAADIYNMLIIDDNIEDNTHNMTRFLILAREPLRESEIEMPALTTILFQTSHQPGALLKALEAFARHGINLTKLETYMISQEKPLPRFYVDVGGAIGEERMKKALREFKKYTASYNILGCYPASPKRKGDNSFLMPD